MSDRRFRYKVTHVFPSMEGRLEVGDVLVDEWRGKSYTQQLENKGVVNPGWSAELVEEYPGGAKALAEARA